MSSPLEEQFRVPPVAWLIVAAIATVFGWGQGTHAQGRPQSGELEALQVRPNVYLIVGGGANVVVHLGWMGAVVVDTGSAEMSDKVLATITRLTDKRIRFIINTTADADHVGGNEVLAKAGRTLLLYDSNGSGFSGSDFQTNYGAAGIMAHENVLSRMSSPGGQQKAYPSVAWPTETYAGARNRSLYLNNDGVQIIYQPAAHSDADSVVIFRRADVIVTGDILDTRHFPIIDLDRGGSINGEIAALTRLIELSIPAAPLVWHEDRTLIVPGHGRVLDQADVVEYRDMVQIIRDVIQDMIKRGMTLEQVKKADPTKGYRGQYGADTGPWTTDMFVTAVYKSLTTTKS